MVNSVGYGGSYPEQAYLPNTFYADGVRHIVVFMHDNHLNIVDIGVHGHMVFSQAVPLNTWVLPDTVGLSEGRGQLCPVR